MVHLGTIQISKKMGFFGGGGLGLVGLGVHITLVCPKKFGSLNSPFHRTESD